MPGRKTVRRPKKAGQNAHDGISNNHNNDSNDLGDAPKLKPKRTHSLSNQEEGVLYTVKVTERPPKSKAKLSIGDLHKKADNRDSSNGDEPNSPPSRQTQQFTITKMKKHNINWLGGIMRSFGIDFGQPEDVDSHLYRPSKPLLNYINWTFYASFSAVFLSFLGIFIVLCLAFAGLFALAGEMHGECIVVSGEPYGSNPETKFGDAFALSWTTFTTVGYGNVYTATGNDFESVDTTDCSGVVFLCTLEAFMGLIYAGMCAAILFGKVNRVQSHAHITFANAVCLQYEEVDDDDVVDDDSSDSDYSSKDQVDIPQAIKEDDTNEEDKKDGDEVVAEKPKVTFKMLGQKVLQHTKTQKFIEQFKGCPVLKFQVVNDLCNKAGGEIMDAMMKVVGIKVKRRGGKITHSQYVRVNLVDYEHPFFGRVWHGVHILDETSPLLNDNARHKLQENGGKGWPEDWLEPAKIRRKLDFQSLVVTVAGVSNVSACTVHAYKRYKFEDVIIGFDYAPLVYENDDTGKLEVDLRLANDVREQHGGKGESLDCSDYVEDESSRSLTSSFSRGTSTIFKKSELQPVVERKKRQTIF